MPDREDRIPGHPEQKKRHHWGCMVKLGSQHRDCCTTDVYRNHSCSSVLEVPVYRNVIKLACIWQEPPGNTVKATIDNPRVSDPTSSTREDKDLRAFRGFNGDRSAFCTRPWQGLWIPWKSTKGLMYNSNPEWEWPTYSHIPGQKYIPKYISISN